jgi:hypothetical protein
VALLRNYPPRFQTPPSLVSSAGGDDTTDYSSEEQEPLILYMA